GPGGGQGSLVCWVVGDSAVEDAGGQGSHRRGRAALLRLARWFDAADAPAAHDVYAAAFAAYPARFLGGAGDAAARFADDTAGFLDEMERIGAHLKQARPTAVNLFWAVDRVLAVLRAAAQGGAGGHSPTPAPLAERLLEEAHRIADEDRRVNYAIGRHGAPLLEPGGVLHHCNTGALATVDYGTALGVIRAAHAAGTPIHVYASETRPFLQGARLTTWELLQEGIPTTLITDNMAAHVMAKGMVKSVIVGADRVTANGDVVNKIGTYGLAVLAKEHGIPFYVAAPVSTLDLSLKSGDEVVIEERDPREVTHVQGRRIAPEGVNVYNPAFDVTPARYVTAIITEYGVVRPPYEEGLAAVVAMAKKEANRA
ncbi:MAG: S-methyl-5-thioribose-1-phosphate isomerase, partial [Limnochordales bacterium]